MGSVLPVLLYLAIEGPMGKEEEKVAVQQGSGVSLVAYTPGQCCARAGHTLISTCDTVISSLRSSVECLRHSNWQTLCTRALHIC